MGIMGKKLFSIILSAALCLSFSTFGVFAASDTGNGASASTVSAADNANDSNAGGKILQLAPIYGDNNIGEIYSAKGSYTDSVKNKWQYSYQVPKIKATSADAVAINKAINAKFGKIARESLIAVKKKDSLGCSKIIWNSHWNGSVLSLVVKASYDDASTDYGVYNFDFATGNKVTNSELLTKLGISNDTFIAAARRAAANKSDSLYGDIPASDQYNYGVLETRAWTISNANINMKAKMYLDGKGRLCVVTPVGSIAGAAWYYKVIRPDFSTDSESADPSTASVKFVTAALKDGKVTVTFNKTDESANYLSAIKNVEYGKEYQVNGTFAKYTGIYADTIGNEFNPYVFLVTKEGRVEFVDVFAGMKAGYLCSSGTLPGFKSIVSIKSVDNTAADGSISHTVYAIDSNGTKHDLMKAVTTMEGWVSPIYVQGKWRSGTITHTVATGGSYTSRYTLLIKKNVMNITDVNKATGVTVKTKATLRYLGMNEYGMVYSCYTSDYGYGALSFINQSSFEGIMIKVMTGTQLFDAQNGKYTKFNYYSN